MLNVGNARIYLFATVIMIEDAQYESTGGIGLSFLLICGRGDGGFAKDCPCFSPNSMSFPSRNLCFSCSLSIFAADVETGSEGMYWFDVLSRVGVITSRC